MGQVNDAQVGDGTRNPQASDSNSSTQRMTRGVYLSFNTLTNEYVLYERGRAKVVTPTWVDGELCIGCTAIGEEAFKRLRELNP